MGPLPKLGHALQLKMGGGGTQLFPKYLSQCPQGGSDADQEGSGFGALLISPAQEGRGGVPLWRKAGDRIETCYVSGVVVRSLARTWILHSSSLSSGTHHGLADLSSKMHPPPPGRPGAGGAGWVPTSRGGVPWGWGGADGGQGRPLQRGRAALAFKRQ